MTKGYLVDIDNNDIIFFERFYGFFINFKDIGFIRFAGLAGLA